MSLISNASQAITHMSLPKVCVARNIAINSDAVRDTFRDHPELSGDERSGHLSESRLCAFRKRMVNAGTKGLHCILA